MEVIIGIKFAPSDHESNFKKVGLIPSGFHTMGIILCGPMISYSYLQDDSSDDIFYVDPSSPDTSPYVTGSKVIILIVLIPHLMLLEAR